MEETMTAHLVRDPAARDATIANLRGTMLERYWGWCQNIEVLYHREHEVELLQTQVGRLQRRNARLVQRQGIMVYEIAQLRAANRRLTLRTEQRDDVLEDHRGWLFQARSDNDYHQRELVQRDNIIGAQGQQIRQV